jgi:hypothetical protein
MAFNFMNRFSVSHIIDSTTFTQKQFPEAALQSMANQMLHGFRYVVLHHPTAVTIYFCGVSVSQLFPSCSQVSIFCNVLHSGI